MPSNYQGLNKFHQVMERSWTDTCVTTIAFAFFKYHDDSLMRFDSNSSLCYDVSFVFLKRTFKMQQDGALTNCSKWPVEQFSLSHVLSRFSNLCVEQKSYLGAKGTNLMYGLEVFTQRHCGCPMSITQIDFHICQNMSWSGVGEIIFMFLYHIFKAVLKHFHFMQARRLRMKNE